MATDADSLIAPESHHYRYEGQHAVVWHLRKAFLKGLLTAFAAASILILYRGMVNALGRPLLDAANYALSGLCVAAWMTGLASAIVAGLYVDRPEVEVRNDGLGVTTLAGWQVIPWSQVLRVEVRRHQFVSEEARIYLRAVPFWQRLRLLLHGIYFMPYLRLSPALDGYRELLAEIERHVTAIR